jgi:hypothetical protein
MPTAGVVTAEAYTICLSQLEHEFATDRCGIVLGRQGPEVQIFSPRPNFPYSNKRVSRLPGAIHLSANSLSSGITTITIVPIPPCPVMLRPNWQAKSKMRRQIWPTTVGNADCKPARPACCQARRVSALRRLCSTCCRQSLLLLSRTVMRCAPT